MVTEAEFPFEGYALVVKKKVAGEFCLRCIREFVAKRPTLRFLESADLLTIISS